MSVWTQPSPSDIDRAAQRIANGEPISDACKAEGFTLTQLRQCDRQSWAELKQLWHDVQGIEDRHTARETLRTIATNTEVDARDRNRAAELLGRSSGYLSDRVEVTGAEGGPMEVNSPDVAAALDRFTALTDRAIRAAAGEPAGLDAAGDRRLDEGEPRLHLAELDRTAGTSRT